MENVRKPSVDELIRLIAEEQERKRAEKRQRRREKIILTVVIILLGIVIGVAVVKAEVKVVTSDSENWIVVEEKGEWVEECTPWVNCNPWSPTWDGRCCRICDGQWECEVQSSGEVTD